MSFIGNILVMDSVTKFVLAMKQTANAHLYQLSSIHPETCHKDSSILHLKELCSIFLVKVSIVESFPVQTDSEFLWPGLQR